MSCLALQIYKTDAKSFVWSRKNTHALFPAPMLQKTGDIPIQIGSLIYFVNLLLHDSYFSNHFICEEKYFTCGPSTSLSTVHFHPKLHRHSTNNKMKPLKPGNSTNIQSNTIYLFSVLRPFCLGEQCPKSYLIALQTT